MDEFFLFTPDGIPFYSISNLGEHGSSHLSLITRATAEAPMKRTCAGLPKDYCDAIAAICKSGVGDPLFSSVGAPVTQVSVGKGITYPSAPPSYSSLPE